MYNRKVRQWNETQLTKLTFRGATPTRRAEWAKQAAEAFRAIARETRMPLDASVNIEAELQEFAYETVAYPYADSVRLLCLVTLAAENFLAAHSEKENS